MNLIPPKELKPIDWEHTITQFGTLTLLYCLNTLQKDEFYEECAIIRDVLKSSTYDLNAFSEEAFKEVADTWSEQVGKPISRKNLERTYGLYATEILIKIGYTPSEPYMVGKLD